MSPRMTTFAALVFLLALPSCNSWQPPVPSDDELSRGLIVLYPGGGNSNNEMLSLHDGLRMAGLTQAIEVVRWAGPYEDLLDPQRRFERNRAWASSEAERIAKYMRQYSNRPVDLIGASAGAMLTIMVAEALPDGVAVDRVILISPDVSAQYDLSAMLNRTSRGAVCYWSPLDVFDLWAAFTFETYDARRSEPASTFGFDSDDPRVIQFHWTSEMLVDGSIGQHLDFALLPLWIRDFIAPRITPAPAEATSPAADAAGPERSRRNSPDDCPHRRLPLPAATE